MNNATKPLQLASIYLKNFRCFNEFTLDLDKPVVLIYGSNGAGKTSLLEALHYACYLRSFRKQLTRDLIAFGKESFFIKINIHNNMWDSPLDHNINVGFVNGKRHIKVDNKTISSYKELLQHYRIVSITEDDLSLIKGSPQERRSFLDQMIIVCNPSYSVYFRDFRAVLENRNTLLLKEKIDKETYIILTEQLWEKTQILQKARTHILNQCMHEINAMLSVYFNNMLSIDLLYRPRKNSDITSFDIFYKKNNNLLDEECRYRRSLFGAHLDDFEIIFKEKKLKPYASRGQQKLTLVLLKVAIVKILISHKQAAIFLLDDFMTDFDYKHTDILLSILLELNSQLIFTVPHQNSVLEDLLKKSDFSYKIISM